MQICVNAFISLTKSWFKKPLLGFSGSRIHLKYLSKQSSDKLICIREIHPLEPQRHRHSMLAPRVCAPRVTRCSLGHVIWSVQLACSILSRSDSCQGDGRQRHLMMHGQCPIPVYSSQFAWIYFGRRTSLGAKSHLKWLLTRVLFWDMACRGHVYTLINFMFWSLICQQFWWPGFRKNGIYVCYL